MTSAALADVASVSPAPASAGAVEPARECSNYPPALLSEEETSRYVFARWAGLFERLAKRTDGR